ncbi:MAG: type II methionyl aminopeptidase [Candidatus Micrarchaeia archaeon]
MLDNELQAFREAGRIASKIREDSKRLIIVGESLLDVAETIEQMIAEEGARPAFPVNISINEIAAHYTPEFESAATLGEKDLVKIDLGIAVPYVEGGRAGDALSDTAYTVDLDGSNSKLVEASTRALEMAIKSIRPGVSVGEIGGTIEDTIKGYGFKPISNLSGHMIKSNELHAGVEIPNVKTADPYRFKEGDIFAVEPFATTGEGYVEDLEQVEIFSIYMPSKIRMRQSRKIVEFVVKNYGMLPFAERWVRKGFESKLLVSAALKELLQNHFIRGYPVLREVGKGLVSQTEHTILVTKDGCEVLTR